MRRLCTLGVAICLDPYKRLTPIYLRLGSYGRSCLVDGLDHDENICFRHLFSTMATRVNEIRHRYAIPNAISILEDADVPSGVTRIYTRAWGEYSEGERRSLKLWANSGRDMDFESYIQYISFRVKYSSCCIIR